MAPPRVPRAATARHWSAARRSAVLAGLQDRTYQCFPFDAILSKIHSKRWRHRAQNANTCRGRRHTLCVMMAEGYSTRMPCTPRLQGTATGDKMNAPLPEHIRRALETVTLDDKYSLDYGRAFMSGVQALVKLPMLQRLRDQQQGKNTAGFISGYRGSPLGGYDQALWKAKNYLQAQNIVFQPGVNEELAATALWGSQQ